MKINFYATLRAIVGQKTIEIETYPGITAIEVVKKVVAMYPALGPELLDSENRFQKHMKFIINGRDTDFLEEAMDTIVQPIDKVDIFPPVGGG